MCEFEAREGQIWTELCVSKETRNHTTQLTSDTHFHVRGDKHYLGVTKVTRGLMESLIIGAFYTGH